MKILFLVHSFNSLSQRIYTELTEDGHDISIEFDVNDAVTEEAVTLFQPDLILAPFLRRAIPASVFLKVPCLVVHPGIRGDRGPSALDHAILRGEKNWGVTVIQATEEFDAGPVWAFEGFAMRETRKASLYRNEVTEAAVKAIRSTLDQWTKSTHPSLEGPSPEGNGPRGQWNGPCTQLERHIDWQQDGVQDILRKIRSADSRPGLLDRILGDEFYLFNAYPEHGLKGNPGQLLAVRDEAICLGATDGAVWITHMQKKGEGEIKLPAARVCSHLLKDVAHTEIPIDAPADIFREIRYEEDGEIGYLHFDFYNGAMNTEQCQRLKSALAEVARRPSQILVLLGSEDFWSNGIHLNTIEAAESPADESMRNIEAMDDLCLAILEMQSKLTIAAMQGNAGAGGVFFALAADRVWAREGIVLNPHYKSMGNLFGSEYWTYLLPARIGQERTAQVMQNRLPLSAKQARNLGLIDDTFGERPKDFRSHVQEKARAILPDLESLLEEKRNRRHNDEALRPLNDYRAQELDSMRLNFYGFDPSYHVARYNFVHRVPHARTPLYLAGHRRAASTVR